MKILPYDDIYIDEKRQRSKIRKEPLMDLKESILSIGLLSPPIVTYTSNGAAADGPKHKLICGARRMAAIKLIQDEGALFRCNGEIISPGEVPTLALHDINPATLFEAELSENVIREQLEWADEMRAIAELHRMRKEANPAQTVVQTARELAAKAHPEGAAPQAKSYDGGGVRNYRNKIAQALTIDAHLDEPEIAKARNAKEAFQLVLKREQATYQAELLRRKGQAASSIQCDMRHGNMLEILPQLDAGRFDLLLCDPPYGVGASKPGHRARSVHHHNYEDTPENARLLLRTLLTEGWRICKPRANLFIFNDNDNWEYFRTTASQMGWAVWPWPVIWQKSEHEGMTGGWGSQGFIRTYEMVFFATKGQRGLLRTELDILTEARVSRAQRIHGAEKPLGLLDLLITLTTMPGDHIIDPCAGSGSTLVAAKRLRRHSLGIELDKVVADEAFVRVNATKEDEVTTGPDAPGEEDDEAEGFADEETEDDN